MTYDRERGSYWRMSAFLVFPVWTVFVNAVRDGYGVQKAWHLSRIVKRIGR